MLLECILHNLFSIITNAIKQISTIKEFMIFGAEEIL